MSRPAALATLAVVGALLVATTAPAAAAPPVVIISEPENGAVVTSRGSKVTGQVRTHDLDRVASTITAVVITVSSPSGRSECSNCWTPTPPDATFETPPLDFNGPYSVTVKATRSDVLGSETSEATRSFQVEVPPSPPRDVKVEVDPDRRVTISWARNSEPDVRYRVSRVAPGSGEVVLPPVPQPESGSRVSTVDGALPPAGGTYRYVVTAMRPGGDGSLDGVTARSSPAAVEVAAAPAEGGGPGAGGPGSGLTAPAGRGAGAGVSSLLSGIGSTPTSVLAVPDEGPLEVDDGFSLPGGEGSESADPAVLDDSRTAVNRRALFIPLAAGLFLCVLAFHLREFSRTVLAPPPAYHPIFEEEGGPGAGREPRTRVLVGPHGPETAEPPSRE